MKKPIANRVLRATDFAAAVFGPDFSDIFLALSDSFHFWEMLSKVKGKEKGMRVSIEYSNKKKERERKERKGRKGKGKLNN